MKKIRFERWTPSGMMIRFIKFYRSRISPYKKPMCKYIPTCSQYALDAFEEYGFLKAFLLVSWRLLRCNPFSMGGYDPVIKKRKLQ